MARSYDELSIMAARFGFRLAKPRRGSQHLGMPVRYSRDGTTVDLVKEAVIRDAMAAGSSVARS
jgi:hypothetical protein